MRLPGDKEEHQGKGGWIEVVPQEEEQLVLQGRNKGNKHEALAKTLASAGIRPPASFVSFGKWSDLLEP